MILGEPVLHGNGRDDDTPALRALLAGRPVLDARIGLQIAVASWAELPPGLYRVKVPLHWQFATREPYWRALAIPSG